ncbi:MAG: VWA domain-containing protein, partial [Thermoplasmata archaeon]
MTRSLNLIIIGCIVFGFALPIYDQSCAQSNSVENPMSVRSTVETGLSPQLALNKTYNPPEIWIKGSVNEPQETTVRLNLTGVGDPRIIFDPQDVVFVMDTSGSMDYSDPANYRYTATRGYLENLLYPDRASVVQFGYDAWLVNDHHLSSDFEQVIEDLEEEPKYRGQTNYEAA